jgi:hypothetical protein
MFLLVDTRYPTPAPPLQEINPSYPSRYVQTPPSSHSSANVYSSRLSSPPPENSSFPSSNSFHPSQSQSSGSLFDIEANFASYIEFMVQYAFSSSPH